MTADYVVDSAKEHGQDFKIDMLKQVKLQNRISKAWLYQVFGGGSYFKARLWMNIRLGYNYL